MVRICDSKTVRELYFHRIPNCVVELICRCPKNEQLFHFDIIYHENSSHLLGSIRPKLEIIKAYSHWQFFQARSERFSMDTGVFFCAIHIGDFPAIF